MSTVWPILYPALLARQILARVARLPQRLHSANATLATRDPMVVYVTSVWLESTNQASVLTHVFHVMTMHTRHQLALPSQRVRATLDTLERMVQYVSNVELENTMKIGLMFAKVACQIRIRKQAARKVQIAFAMQDILVQMVDPVRNALPILSVQLEQSANHLPHHNILSMTQVQVKVFICPHVRRIPCQQPAVKALQIANVRMGIPVQMVARVIVVQ